VSDVIAYGSNGQRGYAACKVCEWRVEAELADPLAWEQGVLVPAYQHEQEHDPDAVPSQPVRMYLLENQVDELEFKLAGLIKRLEGSNGG
jgi:hypothetical protein